MHFSWRHFQCTTRTQIDRLLIAQAISEPLHLVTADPQFKQYSELVIEKFRTAHLAG